MSTRIQALVEARKQGNDVFVRGEGRITQEMVFTEVFLGHEKTLTSLAHAVGASLPSQAVAVDALLEEGLINANSRWAVRRLCLERRQTPRTSHISLSERFSRSLEQAPKSA